MSEYRFVEKPFLDQLGKLGWTVIDHGPSPEPPTDPTLSRRTSFREIVIKSEFFAALDALNQTSGKPWLTTKQREDIYAEFAHQPGDLIAANQALQALLTKYTADINEATGEQHPDVTIIDFKNLARNRFLAVNQFRIDTPGRVKSFIIPDIVLFVNGLPLVVIEAKDANAFTANPLAEAMTQLWRYSNARAETKEAGLLEGEERLFHFNQFVIATTGDEARYATITADTDRYFFHWKSIYPETYREFTPPLGKARAQETLIQGMLPPATLLDIVRNFTIFMQAGEATIKVAPRYQQYRAVGKICERLTNGATPQERSGVIWHTQGSGKSLTMVFLVRRLRRIAALKDFKVIMVVDRNDLEEQLGDTAGLTAEKVTEIGSTEDLKAELADDRSNLNLVMIHKFMEREFGAPDYLNKAIHGDAIPKFKPFGEINPSDRILILIDEAHRTQGSDFGHNLSIAFPNATKIAFTGTPLITERHEKKTTDRFGGRYIDQYKLQDAVDDGATVQILYEGKTADTAINAKHEFDRKFEDLFKDRPAKEIAAIKRKYGAIGDVFEAEARIQEISDDIIEHYATKILPNGFKAQIVCHSKDAAITYEKCLTKSVAAWLEKAEADPQADAALLERLRILKAVVVISSDGTNEKAEITEARKRARAINAVENFKKKFNPEKPETGIGFLIVCDMLLTGFDAPIEQVMYIDKRITEHNLLQAIARVNRIADGKSKGYIVDYVGLTDYLRAALSIYAREDVDEILKSFKGVDAEIPVLEARYKRLMALFEDAGVARARHFVEQKIKDDVEEFETREAMLDALEDLKRRESFDVYLRNFLASLDVVMPNPAGRDYWVPAKRLAYIHAQARQRFKDGSISLAGVGGKVRKLIDEHLIGLGINPKIPIVELFSDRFIEELDQGKSAKSKASEMEHAIRKHCKIHLDEDPAFFKTISEKLDAAIQKHKTSWDQLVATLFDIREEARQGRQDNSDGVAPEEAPFYDLIKMACFEGRAPTEIQKAAMKKAVSQMYEAFENTIDIVNFWQNNYEIKKLRSELTNILLLSKDESLIASRERIVTELVSLAKHRHDRIVGS